MIPVRVGETLPLLAIVDDESSDKVVKCDVIVRDPYQVLHSDLTLAFESGSDGHYRNDSIDMPDFAVVTALYALYKSDGTTLLGKSEENFYRADWTNPDGGSLYAEIDNDDDEIVAYLDDSFD